MQSSAVDGKPTTGGILIEKDPVSYHQVEKWKNKEKRS